ncbi:MAG TPA: proline dehydrogenase family protein [Bacteroidota bacterium]|nr:proline dehydrogenase family protein [Bacteroidota bacterium]
MRVLNKIVVGAIPFIPRPMVRYFAGRYIAGETLEDAVRTVRALMAEGVCATLDVLGEDVTTRDEAIASREQSNAVLETIVREKLDSNLSIKLTSLGLKLDKAFCTENVREILKAASRHGIFVRFDMEDSSCTSDTIDIFRTLHAEFPNTGIVLQAYMRRTCDDARALLGDRPNFRLCKGIYRERPEIAFQGREEVQKNFIRVLGLMLEHRAYVGIATHDTVLVDGAGDLIRRGALRRDQYEFQMLLGVRPELRKRLVREGHRVRLYVPFGQHWYGYSTRRFKENPEIAGYVFKALFMRNQ